MIQIKSSHSLPFLLADGDLLGLGLLRGAGLVLLLLLVGLERSVGGIVVHGQALVRRDHRTRKREIRDCFEEECLRNIFTHALRTNQIQVQGY